MKREVKGTATSQRLGNTALEPSGYYRSSPELTLTRQVMKV